MSMAAMIDATVLSVVTLSTLKIMLFQEKFGSVVTLLPLRMTTIFYDKFCLVVIFFAAKKNNDIAQQTEIVSWNSKHFLKVNSWSRIGF